MSSYTIFNQKVTEFMNDLILAYPEIEQFKSLKAAFTVLKNVSEQTPLKYYNKYVVAKYRKQIKERDEEFFLKCKDYDDIKDVSATPEYWEDFLEQLKIMWATMSADNKEAIWNYFTILTLLAEKVAV